MRVKFIKSVIYLLFFLVILFPGQIFAISHISADGDPLEVPGSIYIITVGTLTTGTWNADTITVPYGGTGGITFTDHGVLLGSGTDAFTATDAFTDGQLLIGSTGADPVPAALTMGDGLDSTAAAGTLELDLDLKAGGGLVIEATELALDMGAVSITGTLAVSSGGTGATTLADGGLVIGNITGAVEVVAAGLTTQILVGGGAATAPIWGTDIPTAVTIGTAYIYRVGGTDVAVTDGGTGITSPADHAVIVGSGATAMTELTVGTDGQILIGSTAADPVFADLTAGDALAATTGAGTLELDVVIADIVTMLEALVGAARLSHDTGLSDISIDDHHAQSHTIVSHDTTGTGANLTTLTDNSMADTLHRHSELSASDGTPDQALIVDATGNVGINQATPGSLLDLGGNGVNLEVGDFSFIGNEQSGKSFVAGFNAKANESVNNQFIVSLTQGGAGYAGIRMGYNGSSYGNIEFFTNVGAVTAGDVITVPAMSINGAGRVDVTYSINSGTLTFSTVGPTDNLDVSGINTLFIDNSGNAVTIGGFAGGVDGQVLHIALINAGAHNVIMEHNEGGATQPLLLHRGSDETLNTEYGGWVFVNHGGVDWHDVSHARH